MGVFKNFRRWLATKICPELDLIARRHWRLRTDLSLDRHWLGYDYPEIDIFAFRAQVMDANYGRGIDDPPFSMVAGGVDWSSDISMFREQLRRKFPPRSTLKQEDAT